MCRKIRERPCFPRKHILPLPHGFDPDSVATAQWQPRPVAQTVTPSVPCRFLPGFHSPRDTRGHSDPYHPVTQHADRSLSQFLTVTAVKQAFLYLHSSHVKIGDRLLLGCVEGAWKKRGPGRYREHTLNPLFSSGLPLLISKGRKGMLTRVVRTHTHTQMCTHTCAHTPRIPPENSCLPGTDGRMPFSDSTVPGAMWELGGGQQGMTLVLRLLADRHRDISL